MSQSVSTAGAPAGNQNAKKAKIFEEAVKRALARSSGESVDAGLDKVADRLVIAANAGEQWAIKEIADRLDGRAVQSTTLGGDGTAVILQGIIELVKPA